MIIFEIFLALFCFGYGIQYATQEKDSIPNIIVKTIVFTVFCPLFLGLDIFDYLKQDETEWE